MTSSKFIITIFIVIIILFIFIGLFFAIFPINTTVQEDYYLSRYSNVAIWGPKIPVEGERGTCLLYEFPSGIDTGSNEVCGKIGVVPGQPTLNTVILNGKTGVDPNICFDIDQIVAIKVERTCINNELNNANGDTDLNFCVREDGTRVAIGETEELYSRTFLNTESLKTENCNTDLCAGILSLYAVKYSFLNSDFQLSPPACQDPLCIISNNDGSFSLTDGCDISDERQLFRVTRGSSPALILPTNFNLNNTGRDGPVASIFSRSDGQCLVPNSNITSLTLGDCNPDWLLQDAITGNNNSSPQQTLYIGDITQDQFQELQFKSGDELIEAIRVLNLRSIQVNNNGDLILDTFFFTSNDFPDFDNALMASSQYIDYNLYNQMMRSLSTFTFN